MADDCDRARILQQAEIDRALANRPKLPRARYTGNCHTCDAPVGYKQRWCNAECRDEWEQDIKRRARR